MEKQLEKFNSCSCLNGTDVLLFITLLLSWYLHSVDKNVWIPQMDLFLKYRWKESVFLSHDQKFFLCETVYSDFFKSTCNLSINVKSWKL